MVKRKPLGVVPVLILGFFIAPGLGGASPGPLLTKVFAQKPHIDQIERKIPELMAAAGVPGMSMALVQGGRVVYSRGFGVRSTRTGQRVDDRTVFEAASLTKPFFACLVMKLVEAGRLDLDKPLIEYAPEEYIVQHYVNHPLTLEGFRRDRFAKITARQVLSHSSGLPHGQPRRPLPILFEPGEKHRYSAEGYLYLQRIVEHMTGQLLEQAVREMLFEPLGMKDSFMAWRDELGSRVALGHDSLGGTKDHFGKRTQVDAAASLYTTASDYGRFVAALLAGRILKPKTLATMLAPQVQVAEDLSWSLGFGLEQTQAGTAFWQWGDDLFYRNYIVAYPKHGIAVVYLTNSQNGLAIGQDVLDVAIGNARDLGLAFLKYERWDTPFGRLMQAVRQQGVGGALSLFREHRTSPSTAFREQDLNRLGYELLNSNRTGEAVEVLRLNAETFPDSANVWDSLAEANMKAGEDEQALRLYQKAIEVAGRDKQAKPDVLESLVKGAKEKVEKLTQRQQRRLSQEEAVRRYSPLLGDYRFEVPGVGVVVVNVFAAKGLLWSKTDGDHSGSRSEFIPIADKPLVFRLDSPERGLFDWEFIADDKGAIVAARFFHPGMNLRARGTKQ